MPSPPEPVLVVDTDTASDDAVALVLAAASGLARLEAVTTVAGNVPLALAVRNALYTLELVGAGQVPVYAGCDRPLARPLDTAQLVHGEDGMGDIGLPAPTGRPAAGHAVDVLLDLAARSDGELTLVTLGPLTNVATCLGQRPDFLTRFAHVYCMAGAADGVGNVTGTAEYNVWADPEAADVVVRAARADQVTWVGWDVSRRDAVLTDDHQRELRALGTPLALFVDDINQTVRRFCQQVTGLPGYDLPDPVTMAVVLRPDLVLAEETRRVRIGLGTDDRGTMHLDRAVDGRGLTLVRRVDAAGFRRLLFDTCLTAAPAAEAPSEA